MRDEHGFPLPVSSGRQDDEFGESACMWALYSLDNPAVAEVFERPDADQAFEIDVAYELTGWSRRDGGPGRWFWSEPHVRIVRKHVLVKCRGGLDI
jgi:hypothetical protein